MEKERLKLDGGKYEVILENNGSKFECLRSGESWRNLAGDNLIFHMFIKIKEMEDGWNCLKEKLPSEVSEEFKSYFE